MMMQIEPLPLVTIMSYYLIQTQERQ